MCRSLWQTPAASTLIRTCVPAGGGVGTSTSFRGALKSVTWKLFIVSLPLARRLRRGSLADSLLLPENAVAACAPGPTLPRISLRRRDQAGLELPTGYGGHAVSACFFPSLLNRGRAAFPASQTRSWRGLWPQPPRAR